MAGKREDAKRQRREALLDAAQAAFARDAFSMRHIAEVAGTAEVTPYNLFGSKRDLVLALYARVIAAVLADPAVAAETDPTARLLAAIAKSGGNFAEQPTFYRAFFSAMYEKGAGAASPGPAPTDTGVAFWRDLVLAIAAAGHVTPRAGVDTLVRQVVYVISGATMEWIEDTLTAAEWTAIVSHAVIALLLPDAREDIATRLEARRATVAAMLPS